MIMTLKSLMTLCCAFAIAAISCPADAAGKHKRDVKRAPAGGHVDAPTGRQTPARMIEVRPGQWISSWGCYTDEGYGRIGTCDRREGPN